MPGKKKPTSKTKVELQPLRPIASEIDKAMADLKAKQKNATAEEKKTLNLRMTVLKKCRNDLFEFWGI